MVSLEFTPNPNTLKYVVEKTFLEQGAVNFLNPGDALRGSPLASEVFQTPGISAVMIGKNFVTITKAQGFEWDQIHEPTEKIILEFIKSDKPAVLPTWLEAKKQRASAEGSIEERIKKILDEEIRPAVAVDGGDIVFDRFENGIAFLFMQGSCAGCPSSTMTLKMGIETRLKEEIAEIEAVEAI
ncbi:MAG: NifU family protein [Oligoflexia bacterium]|nr:NifU family protein [Oligoflexia bacterium]